jgi:Sulfotransferase domain
LRGELEKIAKFLGKYLSEGQLTQLVKHLRIDSFTKNDAVNYEFCKELGFMNPEGRFIRKGNFVMVEKLIIVIIPEHNGTGKTGDWKNHFGPEINRRIDQWMEENLAGTGLNFITELDQQD